MTEKKTALIIYMSPGGGTRHLARTIEDQIKALGGDVYTLDLGRESDAGPIHEALSAAKDGALLFVGSPVYVGRALPPVMDFLDNLPENSAAAFPFATWGGVTSGIALWEMGKALKAKGCHLVGAAKVLSVHTMMWQEDEPLGEGHPDPDDDAMIRSLVEAVYTKTIGKDDIPLDALDYQPAELKDEMLKITLKKAEEKLPNRKVDPDLCTECGVCADVCPTDAVSFGPYPQFGPGCIFCFNCVRECPEDAIKADMSPVGPRLKARAEQLSERPFTKGFL